MLNYYANNNLHAYAFEKFPDSKTTIRYQKVKKDFLSFLMNAADDDDGDRGWFIE